MVKVLRSLVCGPLEAYVSGFAEHLLGRGYTWAGAGQHVCFIAHLDRWMLAEGVGLSGLSGSVIGQYLAQRRAAGYVEYRSERALRPLLDYLLPQYLAEGKAHLVLAVGCTGGRHRSVAIAEHLADRYREDKEYLVEVVHRHEDAAALAAELSRLI